MVERDRDLVLGEHQARGRDGDRHPQDPKVWAVSRAVSLPDGGRLVIRPIEPEDRLALVGAFERLSDESRYRRFFGPVAQLSERQL